MSIDEEYGGMETLETRRTMTFVTSLCINRQSVFQTNALEELSSRITNATVCANLYSPPDTRSIPPLSVKPGKNLALTRIRHKHLKKLMILIVSLVLLHARIPMQVIRSMLGRLALPRLSILISTAALRLHRQYLQVIALPHR